jgi:heme/copper-type cytochrome/quinol oxidase subunit 3
VVVGSIAASRVPAASVSLGSLAEGAGIAATAGFTAFVWVYVVLRAWQAIEPPAAQAGIPLFVRCELGGMIAILVSLGCVIAGRRARRRTSAWLATAIAVAALMIVVESALIP